MTAKAYYNEWDKDAALWLRELIRRGLIADGEVDERSILDVTADDLRGFTQWHFFAGIGGWSYALRLAGWPDDLPVFTGSPPCQPFSSAGRQKGKDDERHLAPHFISLVGAVRPRVLFGEQVASSAVFGGAAKSGRGKVAGTPEWAWFDDLSDRLEAAHYAVGASDIPSAGVGAPHIRQRTFFGAVRLDLTQGRVGDASDICGGDRATDRGLGSPQRAFDREARQGHGETTGVAGGVGGMVYAHSAGQQAERISPIWPRSEYETIVRGAGGRLADNASPRLEGATGSSIQGRSAGFASGSQRSGLADTSEFGQSGSRFMGRSCDSAAGSNRKIHRTVDDGWSDGLADTSLQHIRPNAPDSPWGNADWLFCRDGKWRPVEPGSFPLAHGVSARVGRLRGYGNAIVPQAAAEFIRAFWEIIESDWQEPPISETPFDPLADL